MIGLRLLEWRQIRTIALASLAFALFGGGVFATSVPASFWHRAVRLIAADLTVMVGVFWFLSSSLYLIFLYFVAREVATVTAGYGIATAFENGLLRHEMKLTTHRAAANLLGECGEFLKKTFKVRAPSVSADGRALTAKIPAFAFDLYPHTVHIVVEPLTDGVCSIRGATETRLILGLPVVDDAGVAILALFAQWMRGTPLSTSGFPRQMWKRVVSSAKSYGASVATFGH